MKITDLEERFDVHFPESYIRFLAGPYVTFRVGERWLNVDELMRWNRPEHYVKEILPLSVNGAGDHLCWLTSEAPSLPIVLCPSDSAEGVFFAPSFEGAVLRLLVDFACGLNGVQSCEELVAVMQNNLRVAREILREGWLEAVNVLCEGSVSESDGRFQYRSQEEASELIKSQLCFDRLDRPFWCCRQ